MPATKLYAELTRHTGWLNTSRALTPEDLKGRILLVDFWTFCCINCMHVIPDLAYLEEKFGDKLTVIGVHSAKFKNEQDSENIRSAILRYGIHHPVVNDFDFSTWERFGIRAWPTFLLIGPDGILREVYSGEGHRAELEKDISALVAKAGDTLNTGKLPLALEQDKQPPSVLSFPAKLAFGAYQNADALYVSDSGHNQIAVLTPDGKLLARIGSGEAGMRDGDLAQAQFRHPQGLLLDYPRLYVADTENHALRLVDFSTQEVTTLAGTGNQGYERKPKDSPALSTPLASPWDVAFYPDKDHIAIAMAGTHQIWSYDIKAQTLDVLAGGGQETLADGVYPRNALAQTSGLSAQGDTLYFVDSETSSLRMLKDGKVTTLIGSGLFDFGYKEGKKGQALLQHPLGVFAAGGSVYVADSYNHSIRRYDTKTQTLSTFAGHGQRGAQDGPEAQASFNEPNALLLAQGRWFIADTNNNAIRVMENGSVHTLDVKEGGEPSAPAFSEQLPNAYALPAQQLAPGASLTFSLEPGWHINDSAPSYMAVYDSQQKPAAYFSLDALRSGKLALPQLPPGNYRLQATLYYCQDKEGSQCLIRSFDTPLTIAAGGKTSLALPLKP